MKTTIDGSIIIRIARLEDTDQLAELCAQLGYPISVELVRHNLIHLLADSSQKVWVAETVDRILVGWIHGIHEWLLESAPRIELGGLVVRKDYRHQGVGSLLLDTVEKWAAEIGCVEVHLRSNTLRTEAHTFYKNHGYTQIKTQFAFSKPISSSK